MHAGRIVVSENAEYDRHLLDMAPIQFFKIARLDWRRL